MASWNSSYGGGYRSYSISEADGFADGVALGMILSVVMLILAFYGLVKAIDLVVRAWRQCRGKSRALRMALFSWLSLGGLVLLSGMAALDASHMATNVGTASSAGASGGMVVLMLAVLWGLATIVLLFVARAVEVHYRQTFFSEPAPLVTKVLHQPWWTSSANQAP